MSETTKYLLRLGILLLVVFLLVWRPRIGWPSRPSQAACVKVRLPRSLARLRTGIYLQIQDGAAIYDTAPKNSLQRWGDWQTLGNVCLEGIELKDSAFRELCVWRRKSSSGHWRGVASIELLFSGKSQLLLLWGSRACRLEIPPGAQYVATRVPTQLPRLREFMIQPNDAASAGLKATKK